MNDGIKRLLVTVVALMELCEFAGSQEGLALVLLTVVDTFWLQWGSTDVSSILLMTVPPTLTLCWWSEHQYS